MLNRKNNIKIKVNNNGLTESKNFIYENQEGSKNYMKTEGKE